METETFDLNGFAKKADPKIVSELMRVVEAAPLHVKASDETGKKEKGHLIWDPVGMNEYLKQQFVAIGWSAKIRIPKAQQALGLDVDFGKDGHLVEVQFSNYPFFLNNVIRTNILFARATPLPHMGAIQSAMLVTKAKLLDASQSTLYYEQAVEQARFLVAENTVAVPLRIVGLMVERDDIVPALLTTYENPRYSRTVIKQERVKVRIGVELEGKKKRARALLVRV